MAPQNKNEYTKIACVSIQVIAIALSKTSIAWGVIATGILGYFICKERFSKRLWVGLALCLVPILIGFILEGPQLLDSAQRFRAYAIFMSGWWKAGHWMLGLGPGSFRATSKAIQAYTGFMVNADGTMWNWGWLHSDWLELVFTHGILGAILAIGVYLQILIKLYKAHDKSLFAILCCIGASAIFNYPKNYFITFFLSAFFVVLAYQKRKT